MPTIGLTLLGYFLGSIPFSILIGKLFLHTDIRQFGSDRNPGAANAWRAGKWQIGLPVLLLDFFKGVLPVYLAVYRFNLAGWQLVPVALSPILGHTFSVFLKFKGGKGIATTFGVWTALLLARGPVLLGLFALLIYLIFASSVWAIILSMVFFGLYLVIASTDLAYLTIWAGNLLILLFKHWGELANEGFPRPRWSSSKP